MIIRKQNKGFILVMTLVMAVIMLVIAFVCLKIFLAPYIAIQSDIIKKKEFYMADTAIEVVREQISNICYQVVTSKERWELLDPKYNVHCLKTEFIGEKKIEDGDRYKILHQNNKNYNKPGLSLLNDNIMPGSNNLVEKYSGDLFNATVKNTLPLISGSGQHKPLIIKVSNIEQWNDWSWYNKKPLGGIEYKNNIYDNKVSATVGIEFENMFSYSDIENNKDWPKELQKDGNDSFRASLSWDYITQNNRIKRRDYVIIATATYTGSDIECHMKYYFSLISVSPQMGDDLS
ncbi:hypothetical protein, partial [Candidatus Ruminimicrobium bovinum]|uniref:hypothetical protein n=1 Tax=Candidatus Ruminimicrobium bovinum TaxID=3242779 RepID=UPI0039B89DC0